MSKFAPHRPSNSNPRATPDTLCQKCLGRGHFTYQCKKTRPYVSRPSRTQLLDDPKLREKEKERRRALNSGGVPDEFKNQDGVANKLLEAKEKARKDEQEKDEAPPRKKIKRTTSSSPSDSDSDSESGSDSSSDSSSQSSSSSRDASVSRSSDNSRDRGRRRQRLSSSKKSMSRSRSPR